jgi:hypothetical protein
VSVKDLLCGEAMNEQGDDLGCPKPWYQSFDVVPVFGLAVCGIGLLLTLVALASFVYLLSTNVD